MTRLAPAGLIRLEGELRPGLTMEIAADGVVRPLAASEIPDLHARLVGPPQSGRRQVLVAAGAFHLPLWLPTQLRLVGAGLDELLDDG